MQNGGDRSTANGDSGPVVSHEVKRPAAPPAGLRCTFYGARRVAGAAVAAAATAGVSSRFALGPTRWGSESVSEAARWSVVNGGLSERWLGWVTACGVPAACGCWQRA